MTRLTDEELRDLEQWAACDLRDRDGDLVQRAVDEIRELRRNIVMFNSYSTYD